MIFSMVPVLLAGAFLGQTPSPGWQNDYQKAMELAVSQKKPLLVAFGARPVAEGPSQAEAQQLLAQQYVCVSVDTATPMGQNLARNFGIQGSQGLVISDRTNSIQAFWHQGVLPSQTLVGYLKKYSDPQLVVTTTETLPIARTSFYPAEESGVNWGPSSLVPNSYCPNCSNGRFRR